MTTFWKLQSDLGAVSFCVRWPHCMPRRDRANCIMTVVKTILDGKSGIVHSIGPDASVFDALKKMADVDVGALIVLDNGKLVGIISERDYARKIVLIGRTSSETRVRDIMSSKVICTRPDQTIEECMAIMTARAVRHLPVLDHKNVVGIVSIGDLVKTIIDDQKFVIEQLESYIHGSH
jgi:CBS domain-containing protein